MNKIDRLRDVSTRQDKQGFINAIYDFSEEDIIRLTEQEFGFVQESCTEIKIDGVSEFFTFLSEEVAQYGDYAIEPTKEALLIIRFYLTIILRTRLVCDRYSTINATFLGAAHRELAELGINSEKNILTSIELYKGVRASAPEKSNEYMIATTYLGASYVSLADIGIDTKKNIEQSIKLQEEARQLARELDDDIKYAQITGDLGFAYLTLAQLGVEPEKNLKLSIDLYQQVQKKTHVDSIDCASATLNNGFAHLLLAELGIESEKNFGKSIRMQKEARGNHNIKRLDCGRTLLNEGRAYSGLAELDINAGKNPYDNLNESIKLLKKARRNLPKNGFDHAGSTIALGQALIKQFDQSGINLKNIFAEAVGLLQEARTNLPEKSFDCATSFGTQGAAHLIIAYHGIEPEKNLKKCIRLQQKAIDILPINLPDYAIAIINQASAYLILAEIDVEAENNFQAAEQSYTMAANIFFEAKDGWKYPLAILGTYAVYRNRFWKSGDKKYLEKASNYFKDAINNIDSWAVFGKNKILGSLCVVEADLYELKEDYYNAGLKYNEAYSLIKNEYYRFMCEFCGAKYSTKTKSFCSFVNNWRDVDKIDIFLDYYDFATFECHLEEALENEALRFDELSKAKIKLDEIFDRTQIFHIRERVGACIDILNAYLNYFPENDDDRNEEEAKKHISSACSIFKSQGYVCEVNLCNRFTKAMKNKDKPEVWLNLIKNNLANNLSKLIGEAAINETMKSQTRGVQADLVDIKTMVEEIKTSVENLMVSLEPGISEELVITVGAEFCGTGVQKVITIPLQNISYAELDEDLAKIKKDVGFKLTSLPTRLFEKVKEYLSLREHIKFLE